jgi:hypothetical protein
MAQGNNRYHFTPKRWARYCPWFWQTKRYVIYRCFFGKTCHVFVHLYILFCLTNNHTHGSSSSICSYKLITNRQTPKHSQKLKNLLEVSPDLPRQEQKLLLRRFSTVGIVLTFCQQPTQLPPQTSSPWCAVCPSYGVGFIDQANLTQETSSTRVN